MNAAQQRDAAHRLALALKAAGITVQRMDVKSGNLKKWEDVPAEGIIGRWLQNGWSVGLITPQPYSTVTFS